MKNVLRSPLFPALFLLLISLPLILPYFQQGFFPTHDGEWAVVRLSDMYREVRDLQIPPRFSGNLNFGYGYPLFNFAYPLPYYLGLPLYLLNFGLTNSIKILFAISVPLSAIGMYYVSKTFWKSKFSGFVSAMLYAYLPYRMVDLYVRGSLGESLASVLFPLILLSVLRLQNRYSILWSSVLSLSIASLILTHNIMAVYFAMILGSYIIFLLFTKKTRDLVPLLMSMLFGIGLSAFFWLPALYEKQYILLSKIPIADRDLYYVSLKQLLYSPFGYGTPTDSHPFTYQVGIFHLTLFLGVIILLVSDVLKRKIIEKSLLVFLVLLVIFFLLLFRFSSFLWETIPLLSEINYPWTLLLPIGFLLSFSAGYLRFTNNFSKVIIIICLMLNCLFVWQFAKPSQYVDRGDGFYFTNDATTTSSRELMPLWVKSNPSSRPTQKAEVIKGKGEVAILENKSQRIIVNAKLQEESTVRINTIYYPGWEWKVDGKSYQFSFNNPLGVMEAKIPQGDHLIEVSLQNTTNRSLANAISLVTLFIGIIIIMLKLRTKKS